MRSSAIVTLRISLLFLGTTTPIAVLSLTAAAQSSQVQSNGAVQAVAAAQSKYVATADSGASTILKTSTSPAEASVSSGAVQPGVATRARATKIGVAGPSLLSGQGAAPAKSSISDLELLIPAQRRAYQRAAAAFNSFCHDWERLLHDREGNNLDHLSWRKDGGMEVATYTGYGRVESCECKQSKEGLPIGKIRYAEKNYSIAGKTIDQARHAVPKLTHEISTLEIFSWDKGRWFY
jgi:hypothetical protein